MKISHFQVINEMLVDGEPALSPIPEDSVIDLVSKFYVLRTNIYVLRFMTNCITLICLTNQHICLTFQDMDDGIKTVKVPFQRERKKSRHLSDPYTPPPPTTPRRSKKCRTRSRVYKSYKKPSLIGPDGNVLQLEPWVEVHIPIFIFYFIYSLNLYVVLYLINHHLIWKCFTSN